MANKLAVIGNGFDLHLNITSSFTDFLKSDIVQKNSIFDENINEKYQQLDRISNLLDNGNEQEYKDQISYLIESHLIFNQISPFENIKIEQESNYWCCYFQYLSKFPNFTNDQDQFSISSSQIHLKNWSDIEFQIQYLLENSKEIFNTFNILQKLDEKYGYTSNQSEIKKASDKLYKSLTNNNTISYKNVLNLIHLQLAIKTGWNFRKQSIYDYLFAELINLENIFKDYLKKIIPDNYEIKAKKLAQKITESDDFNLFNFNYTTFYDSKDITKTNVHSTLKDSDHPIFGISTNSLSGKKNYDEPYYKFTKTFRIMTLSKSNALKDTLPENIDEVIFYGHSLSSIDYLYLKTILDKYINELDNMKIKLTFKYSNYEDNGRFHNMEQNQLISIFKLFNIFDSENTSKSTFQKLLLEHRINIKELED
ncbi:hypothetical protein AKUH1B104J_04780 [Apilactobacillus kunkeei]|nr:hypothetical protein AKUH1B104J_04780 [Apilactobacillus kunkeei]